MARPAWIISSRRWKNRQRKRAGVLSEQSKRTRRSCQNKEQEEELRRVARRYLVCCDCVRTFQGLSRRRLRLKGLHRRGNDDDADSQMYIISSVCWQLREATRFLLCTESFCEFAPRLFLLARRCSAGTRTVLWGTGKTRLMR